MLRQQKDNVLFNALEALRYDRTLTSANVLRLIDKYPAAAGRKDHDDNYPLHLACRYGLSEEIIIKLIDMYPHAVKVENKDGLYPLHIACQFCQSESVILRLIELFRQAVSEPWEEDNFPLHIACKYNRQSVSVVCKLMKIFPEATAIQSTYFDNMYPLHLACKYRKSEEVIRKLVQTFPEALRIKDSLSEYPIHHAIHSAYRIRHAIHIRSSLEVIMLLVNTDPFILQLKNKDGMTPFHCACYDEYSKNKMDIVEYFLQHSSSSSSSSILINVPNNNGETPLHTSCSIGRKEIVQAIVKHVDILDVNATNDIGDTALHKAIRSARYDQEKNSYDIVQSLLQHPWIDINIRNELNETPLDLVKHRIIDYAKYGSNYQKTRVLSIDEKIRTLLEDFYVKRKWLAYEYFLENFGRIRH